MTRGSHCSVSGRATITTRISSISLLHLRIPVGGHARDALVVDRVDCVTRRTLSLPICSCFFKGMAVFANCQRSNHSLEAKSLVKRTPEHSRGRSSRHPNHDVSTTRAIVLFDGVCNFCNASVNFLIDRDPAGRFVFGALQSEEGKQVLSEHGLEDGYFDSIVLIDGDNVTTASDAVLDISRHMSGAWPLLRVFRIVPRFIRDGVYNWIARNRYAWFGKQDSCRIPTPEYRARFL